MTTSRCIYLTLAVLDDSTCISIWRLKWGSFPKRFQKLWSKFERRLGALWSTAMCTDFHVETLSSHTCPRRKTVTAKIFASWKRALYPRTRPSPWSSGLIVRLTHALVICADGTKAAQNNFWDANSTSSSTDRKWKAVRSVPTLERSKPKMCETQ